MREIERESEREGEREGECVCRETAPCLHDTSALAPVCVRERERERESVCV